MVTGVYQQPNWTIGGTVGGLTIVSGTPGSFGAPLGVRPAGRVSSVSVQPAPISAPVVTGVDPAEIHNALYGKPIPLSALGLARIGTAGLIFGPYFNGGAASFAVSFGFPANVNGTRRVYEVSLDSKVAWSLAGGSAHGAALDAAGFLSEAFTCRFYGGSMTQGADPLEIAKFSTEAVAYRPQMMLWFENLPVAQFGGKVPFVACKIGDVTGGATPADGLTVGQAMEEVAYSPWLEMDDTFEATGVDDVIQGMILTEQQSFLDLLRNLTRFYRNADILQTDKLRVVDRGSTVTADLTLTRNHIVGEGGVQYVRQEESSVPRELEVLTIDPDADYVFIPSKAARPREPVPVTSSVGKETVTLPIILDANTRASMVTYAKYQEDNARKRVSLQTMLYGCELEPGDLFNLSNIADGFDSVETFKVIDSSLGANYINEITGEAILKCLIPFDPYFGQVVLLLHGNTDDPVVDNSIYQATMTLVGNAAIDTAVKKFGDASFAFDGTGDGVSTGFAVAPEYNISPTNTSPYTIELWVRFDAVARGTAQVLICRDTGVLGLNFILSQGAGSDELGFATSSDGSTFTGSTSTTAANLVAGVWYFIAVDKDSTGKVRIYVDGVMKGSGTPANSVMLVDQTDPITVGIDGLGNRSLLGWIDDVRITTVSRYGDLYGDASFPVPGSPFPDQI